MNRLLFPALILLLTLASACMYRNSTPGNKDINMNIIEKSLQGLKDKRLPETDEGILILQRYSAYLAALEQGDAYTDWREDSCSAVYNPTVFMRMMDKRLLEKITANATAGRDAFAGITGFFERAYISRVDRRLDSYLIYIPQSFNPAKQYPLVLFLHGYGDPAYVSPYSPVHFGLLKACEEREIILAAPNGRHKLPRQPVFYIDDGETDVLQVLASVKQHYPVDEKRIYLTGLSMGGFGTYWLGSRQPELFAAIAPVCAMWSGILGFPRVELDRLKELPVYLVHNSLDQRVPVSESRDAYARLKKIGADVVYREIEGDIDAPWDYAVYSGHNAWDYAYEGNTLIDWFLQYSRP